MQELNPLPEQFNKLSNPPSNIFYRGNINLLNYFKVAIVGTRNPSQYIRSILPLLVRRLANEAIIVSGGAFGIDYMAHIHSFPNTIMVSPVDVNHIYPRSNEHIIKKMMKDALVISEYDNCPTPTLMKKNYSFLHRNRLIIALSDLVIIPEGEIKSGTFSSALHAKQLKKEVFVFPHRLNESSLTNMMLNESSAKGIYSFDEFLSYVKYKKSMLYKEESIPKFQKDLNNVERIIIEKCRNNILFDDLLEEFGDIVLEMEFEGLIECVNDYALPKC